jgi:hypothetical protein
MSRDTDSMYDDPRLLPSATWQTPARGTNDDEYAIYVENARALGWSVKTYDEWLSS